jgi:hypothetical protein
MNRWAEEKNRAQLMNKPMARVPRLIDWILQNVLEAAM